MPVSAAFSIRGVRSFGGVVTVTQDAEPRTGVTLVDPARVTMPPELKTVQEPLGAWRVSVPSEETKA